MPNIKIISRKVAEELINTGFPENAAVISFYDPESRWTDKDYSPLDFSKVSNHVFSVGVHDIDIEVLPEYGLTLETFLPETEKLAEFITFNYADNRDIICQCEYGQSRSAACAAAILQFYEKRGIDIFSDYRYYPNQLVYNKILETLENSPIIHTNERSKPYAEYVEITFENLDWVKIPVKFFKNLAIRGISTEVGIHAHGDYYKSNSADTILFELLPETENFSKSFDGDWRYGDCQTLKDRFARQDIHYIEIGLENDIKEKYVVAWDDADNNEYKNRNQELNITAEGEIRVSIIKK